jgi:hypothetical protein
MASGRRVFNLTLYRKPARLKSLRQKLIYCLVPQLQLKDEREFSLDGVKETGGAVKPARLGRSSLAGGARGLLAILKGEILRLGGHEVCATVSLRPVWSVATLDGVGLP